GQHHVEDDDVVVPVARRLERSGAVAFLVDVEPLAPQHERHDVEDAGIVVDDEDRAHASASSRTRAPSRTIDTRVPWPGADSSDTCPSSERTAWRTIASPSPKPSASRS